MNSQLQRVVHRGGSALAPENTFAAFRNALTLPIDAIELDVQMSRDGHAIVFHDNDVERCTDGKGNILDLDFAYLRSLNAAAHFPGGWQERQQIPTLQEVLQFVRNRVQLCIEIKASKRDHIYGRYPHIAETVVAEVQQAGMLDQVILITFDWTILPKIKSLEPSLQTGAIFSSDLWDFHAEHTLEKLTEKAASLQCDWINIDYELFTSEMPGIIHAAGFKLGLWTVDTLDEMRRFAGAGVDAVTSDRPDLFSALQK